MYEEILRTIKTILLAVILLSMYKIYENGGYSNPITIAVILIVFSLWILFRIELNEEVSQEINEESNNKQLQNNSICGSEQSSNCTTPTRRSKALPPLAIALSNKEERMNKRNSKFRTLVRKRSRSPDIVLK